MKRKSILCYILAALMCVSLIPCLPGELSTATASAASNELVLHLKFDGDLTDSSGNSFNGECTTGAIKYEDGIFGKCAVFDGKSYVEVADTDKLDLKDSFTISFWAYKEDVKNEYVPFIYKEEDGDSWASPYKVYEHDKNNPAIFLHDGDAGTDLNQFFANGKLMDIHKWFLLTITYDGSEVKIYHNNQVVKKQSVTGTIGATKGDLMIGMMNDLYDTLFYKGKMDDLRIYNYGLTGNEVIALYDNGVASKPAYLKHTDSLVAHYKFENNFKDSSGFDNNATKITDDGSLSFVNAICGKGVKFVKGSYLEVEANDSINFDQGFTLTGWICVSKDDVTMPILNRVGSSTSDNRNDFAYRVEATDDTLTYYYSPLVDWYNYENFYHSLSSSMKNKWYHIAVTFDGDEARWYKNGALVQKEELDGLAIAHASGNLMIGSDGQNFLEGTLDELKLYNYALTPAQVKKDYAAKDSLSISSANESSIKKVKVKGTVTIKVTRTNYYTKEKANLTSGVTYKSSNTKIFTVSKTGKITGVKKGTAKLTITHGGISKTYTVTVK